MHIEGKVAHGLWKAARVAAAGVLMGLAIFSGLAKAAPAPEVVGSGSVQTLTLEECLSMALQQNHRRQVSRFAVAVAEAQHRQALSGYWPQINVRGIYQRLDEPPDFLFPASQFYLPPQSITVPGGVATVTVPAGILGPTAVQLPVNFPGQTITTTAQTFPVPPQDVKLMDVNSFVSSLNATWLLYDGGLRRGLSEQARAGLDAAREEARRTDLEISDSVKRMYYGAVLARQLHELGRETLSRMEATLRITETMYKEGSGKVTKSDYLDNKVMVETIRTVVTLLEKNEEMSKAALANTMGLSWKEAIQPSAAEIPFEPQAADLQTLVGTAYQFNPDWARLEAGLRATEGAMKTARSGYFPKLAFTGELHRWWNKYDAGISTAQNKAGWSVGIGIEIPLFDGFLTRERIQEAGARAQKLREEKFLLQEGIGLQIKNIFLGLNATRKSFDATLEAMKAAQENRDLNIRAYQNELVETEKVIRAQLTEALMTAQHYMARYENAALRSQLDLVVGTEVLKQLKSQP